jgi:hypothetical protein
MINLKSRRQVAEVRPRIEKRHLQPPERERFAIVFATFMGTSEDNPATGHAHAFL